MKTLRPAAPPTLSSCQQVLSITVALQQLLAQSRGTSRASCVGDWCAVDAGARIALQSHIEVQATQPPVSLLPSRTDQHSSDGLTIAPAVTQFPLQMLSLRTDAAGCWQRAMHGCFTGSAIGE